MTAVSLITLNWCRWNDLTLPWMRSALATKPDDVQLELVIVDQGSGNGDVDRIRDAAREHPELKPLFLPENVGFPAGCNLGLAAATSSDICIWINNDIDFQGDWLSPIVAALTVDRGRKLIVGTSLIEAGGWNEFTLGEERVVIPYLEGWLLAFWRESICEIGGFDVAYGTGSIEDVDWCHEALKHGYTLQAITPLPLFHKRGSTVTDGRLKHLETTQRNYDYFRRKLVAEQLAEQT